MPAKTDRQLLEDVSGALVRAVLKGEHRLVAVEAREIRPIRVEGLVVEVDELL